MAKFRKRPVVIDAELYRPGLEDGYGLLARDGRLEMFPDGRGGWTADFDGPGQRVPVIKTLEGFHAVTEGDWIITGVKGERYPCKPDVFAASYEPAD